MSDTIAGDASSLEPRGIWGWALYRRRTAGERLAGGLGRRQAIPQMALNAKPRRIVTALDDQGMTYIARVEEVPPNRSEDLPADVRERSYPGGVPDVRVVWDCEELPVTLPADSGLEPSGKLPGPHGVRVSVTILPPGWAGEMFWSNRVDILWVMAGELTYITDRGDEIVVGQGDLVIQNAANKAFFNRGAEPVYMGALMLSAVQGGVTPPLDRYHGPAGGLRYTADHPLLDRRPG